MFFGLCVIENIKTVVTRLGENLINVSKAHVDYHKNVENLEVAELQDIGDLIRGGYLNRSYHKRITEFVHRNGRLQHYTVDPEPGYLIPYTPGKIICIGRNYLAHVAEMNNELPAEPLFFTKLPSSCIGNNAVIEAPEKLGRVDHEGELGVIIGKCGSKIPETEAAGYIAGYTLINDITARDIQKTDAAAGRPWLRAKSMDTFCPMGPVILLSESLSFPPVCDIQVRVNGETKQKSTTGKLIFSIPQLISCVSSYITLEAGDVIATGTPEGVGPLANGDTVEVEIPEIGILRNTVNRN